MDVGFRLFTNAVAQLRARQVESRKKKRQLTLVSKVTKRKCSVWKKGREIDKESRSQFHSPNSTGSRSGMESLAWGEMNDRFDNQCHPGHFPWPGHNPPKSSLGRELLDAFLPATTAHVHCQSSQSPTRSPGQAHLAQGSRCE